nr:phage/plasmid primase, P4 family [Burkholderia ambifaria]
MSKIELGKDASFHEALVVCRAVHGEDQPFTIKWMLRGEDGKSVLKVESTWGTLTEQQKHFAASKADGWEAFMLVGMTNGEGFAKSSVTGSWAVGVDLDYDVDPSRWQRSLFGPSIVVNTSGGRQHVIWIFKQPVANDTFNRMAVALAHRFGGDVCFANVTQAIRLPGFINRKHGTEVKLLRCEPERLYDVAGLAAAFDVDLIAASLQARIPVARSLGVKVVTDDDKHQRLADLREALQYIDPVPFDTWIKVLGAASPLGFDGFKLVDEWSRRASNYDEQRMQVAWNSFDAGSSASPNSIFFLAAERGWSNPGFRRRVAVGPKEVMGERYLGRLLASKMYPDITVVRRGHGEKQTLQALRWVGDHYEALDPFAFRTIVESYCHRLIQKAHGTDSNLAVVTAVSKHSGDGRSLDLLGRAALEFMLEASDALQATDYPYFPVANGVLNLLSGELVPARFKPIAPNNSAVIFDPEARAPRFESFLDEIFECDRNLIGFFLRLCGRMLLGKPKEHLFVIFLGAGRNGKSVTVEVLNAIFGSLASTLGVAALMVQGTMNDGPTPSIVKLERKRFVTVNEPTKKHKLNGGLVKQLTGGDRVAARTLYVEDVEFMPVFTLVMIANEMPGINADDAALWRRITVVPFTRTFSENEIDPDLKETLLHQLPGILNLLLVGLRDYLENGLQPPDKVRRAGSEQRVRADSFEVWREERTMADDVRSQHKSLLDDYFAWVAANPGYEKLGSREFGAKLAAVYTRVEERHYVFYKGVRLKDVSGTS